jgi:predicted ferric reductase
MANDPVLGTSFSDLFPFSSGLHGVNQTQNWTFVNVVILMFCVLLLFTLFLRVAKRIHNYLRQLSVVTNPNNQTFWMHNGTTWWPWLKEHFLYAPLWNVRHNREFNIAMRKDQVSFGTLPGRGHAVLLAVYCLTNFAYCLVLPYGADTKMVIASLRGRSGVLAALNIVPTVLFALRNNPLIDWLEVPYDTFNLLHRWLGRIVVVEGVVHTLAWFGNTVRAGGWEAVHLGFTQLPHGPSYSWGVVATVSFVVISIQAWSPLRHAFYETFLNVHKVLVALAIGGVYIHLKIDFLPQLPWLQICISLWILEYVARAVRILYHNVSLRGAVTKVTVEALPAEACRVTFDLAGQPWEPRGGLHVHCYFPTMCWWGSHPFSVAWNDVRPEAYEVTEKLPSNQQEVDELSLDRPTVALHGQVSVVIRARKGFTRQLYDRASAQPNGTLYTWGFVEGPYGGYDNLASYGTIVMFAGGIGITHQVSYIKDLIHKYKEGVGGTRKIVLVWSVPDTEALEWVRPWMDEILRFPGRREVLKIVLFVTRPRNLREVHSSSGTVLMVPGRCNPQKIIDQEFVERQGAMAVTVCGPGGFADDVRRAARTRVKFGVLDFVEEAFTY